jgi:hypothetical protein
MSAFKVRGTIIIKLTAVYSLIAGLVGVYSSINPRVLTAQYTDANEPVFSILLLLFSLPFLAHALVLFRAWRGAWRSTIILYGFAFISVLNTALHTGLKGGTLVRFIISAAIVFVFWTNTEVKAALSKSKNPTSPTGITLKQKLKDNNSQSLDV